MTERPDYNTFATLKLALGRCIRDWPALLFYSFLLAGLTVVGYFPVLDYYSAVIDMFYGPGELLEPSISAVRQMVMDVAYILPGFVLYLLGIALFLTAWIVRHGRQRGSSADTPASEIFQRGLHVWGKIFGLFGWFALMALPVIFALGFAGTLVWGDALSLPEYYLNAMNLATALILFALLSVSGISIAAIARGERFNALEAWRNIKGQRWLSGLAVLLIFLPGILIRSEGGIWLVDEGLIGGGHATGTLLFLLGSTFLENLTWLVWMTYSERAYEQVRNNPDE